MFTNFTVNFFYSKHFATPASRQLCALGQGLNVICGASPPRRLDPKNVIRVLGVKSFSHVTYFNILKCDNRC